MGVVTSLFARKMVAAAEPGVDARAALAIVGLDPDDPWDPKNMISEAAYYAMLEHMAEVSDVTALPLKVGATMRCDEYGALGLAWKAAPDLLGSYSRVARFARLWTSIVQYELHDTNSGMLWVEHRAGERCLGMRLSIEADMASGVAISNQVSPDRFAPLEVYFKHPAPKTTRHHEEYFGCPVRFEAKYDGMLLSRSSLSTPNILGDEGITRFLISHLEAELSEIAHEPTLKTQTKDAIARALSEGLPKMADIALSLGLSARSYHRRLAEHGLSFQTLAEETRRELAEGLLRDDAYSLAEIAFLTGFSEQSAFTRAFKRWAGLTPASYRRDVTAP